MEHDFLVDETVHDVDIRRRGDDRIAMVGDREYQFEAVASSPNRLSLMVDGRSVQAAVVRADGAVYVHVDGSSYRFTIPGMTEDAGMAGAVGNDGGLTVKAPMPGSVLKVCVKEGEGVAEDQCLVIVEAMKMETELRACVDGRVKKIHVEAAQQVDAGEVLVELESQDDRTD